MNMKIQYVRDSKDEEESEKNEREGMKGREKERERESSKMKRVWDDIMQPEIDADLSILFLLFQRRAFIKRMRES